MKYPSIIQNLIECFKKFPGVGGKTAERMALSVLEIDKETIELFAKSLKESKTKIKRCEKCNNLSEEDKCEICKDKNRNNEILCVVEEPKFVNLFEQLNIFDGYYHVLDGLISPIDGINPEDINIPNLIERVKKDKVKEIILALKPSIEGETTMQYIKRVLSNKDIKITKIATGIPIGTDMEYIDAMTLEMSLEERKEFA